MSHTSPVPVDARAVALATAIVLGTGVLWGLYWLPVRALAQAGLPGAWGTAAIVAAATALLTPAALPALLRGPRPDPFAVLFVAVGGVGFALYSIGFVYGRVAIIILFFYLTPVWSTALAHLMGWPTARLRLLAIAVGILGLVVMLDAGSGVPLPRNPGEWLGLASGLLWSLSTTGIRTRAALAPGLAAFVFAGGATLGALLLAPVLSPLPDALAAGAAWRAAGIALATGALWWGVSVAALMWAVARLEPTRVGILLMSEVLVGAVSAALIAGEALGPAELAGGALVLLAGVLEVWPVRPRQSPGGPS